MRSVNFFIIDRCRVTFRDKGVETCLSRSSADGRSVSPPGTTGANRGTTKVARLRWKSEAAKAVKQHADRRRKDKLTFCDTSVQIYYFFLKRFATSQAFVHRRPLCPLPPRASHTALPKMHRQSVKYQRKEAPCRALSENVLSKVHNKEEKHVDFDRKLGLFPIKVHVFSTRLL